MPVPFSIKSLGNKVIAADRLSKMNRKKLNNQEGNAFVILVVFIALAAMTILAVASSSSFGRLTNLSKSQSLLAEKWEARSAANILGQVVKVLAPKKFDEDTESARQKCSAPIEMPLFDKQSDSVSNPFVSFNDSGELTCQNSSAATSVFGVFGNWSKARIPVLKNEAVALFGIDGKTTDIVEFQELFRRSYGTNSSDVSYTIRYLIEAKVGQYRTSINDELILGANLPGCGTSVLLSASPAQVTAGSQTTLEIRYRYAARIKIYNQAGILLNERNVTEQPDEASYTFPVTIDIDSEFYAVATGSGDCTAESARIEVNAVGNSFLSGGCPVIDSFAASSPSINSGGSVTLSWNVRNFYQITLNGVDVTAMGGSGSKQFDGLTTNSLYTLRAVDAAGLCPVSKQVRVLINRTGCDIPDPVINNFAASSPTAKPNENINLTWSVSRLQGNNQISILMPDGTTTSGLGASGASNVSLPSEPGEYSYVLSAANLCSETSQSKVTREIKITVVKNCQPPQIANFTVSPGQVYQNDNQILNFSWLISDPGNSVIRSYIDFTNGQSGTTALAKDNLALSGNFQIAHEQFSGTYTLRVQNRCGADVVASRNVTVLSEPAGDKLKAYKATWYAVDGMITDTSG